MGMLYLIREEDGVLGAYTETEDEVPETMDSRYIRWDVLPADPPFSSYEDAQERASHYVGMVLSEDGTTLSPRPPAEPVEAPIMTVLQFRDRYTLAEKTGIYTAAESDPMIRVILDDLNNAEFVDITDQDTIDGVDYLISSGVIDASRRDDLLAPILIG